MFATFAHGTSVNEIWCFIIFRQKIPLYNAQLSRFSELFAGLAVTGELKNREGIECVCLRHAL